MHFYDEDAGAYVEHGKEADFLNDYFCIIVQNLNIAQSNDQFQSLYDVPNQCCITDDMPTIPEVLKHRKVIDISKSSCVEGINARFCKVAMLSIPAQIRKLCCTAFETGIIRTPWTKGTITVLPKDGDLTDPSNWRPITQTLIFCKTSRKGDAK